MPAPGYKLRDTRIFCCSTRTNRIGRCRTCNLSHSFSNFCLPGHGANRRNCREVTRSKSCFLFLHNIRTSLVHGLNIPFGTPVPGQSQRSFHHDGRSMSDAKRLTSAILSLCAVDVTRIQGTMMGIGGVLRFGRRKCSGLKGRYNTWREKHFDRRFGISTFGIEYDLVSLGAAGPHVAQAEAYEPIQIPVFNAIMSAARIDPRQYSFIDFGCGKGRALVLAAEHGFKRIIGIEFASSLYELAAHNIAIYRGRKTHAPP